MAPVALILLALAALSQARTEEWRTDLYLWTAAVRSGPQMPRSHLCLGLAHKDRNDWASAHDSFARCRDVAVAQRNASMGARCWNNLGSLSLTLGHLDLAEMAYSQALLLVPGYEDAVANVASVRLEQGDTLAAIDGYRKVLETRPSHAQTWTNLAMALRGRDSTGARIARERADSLTAR